MVIRINCPACKVVNAVAEDKRGKKVRCRKCEKLMLVPVAKDAKKKSEEAAVQEGRKIKAASVRKRDDDDDDETEDEEVRPAKKKKPAQVKSGSGMMLAVGGVAAVLFLGLLGAGGIGAYVMLRANPDGEAKRVAQAEDNKAKEPKDPAEPKKEPIVNKDGVDKKDNPAEPKNDPPGSKDGVEKKGIPAEPKKNPLVEAEPGKPLPAQLAPELLAKAKQATVYLHVTMPSGVTAEGSGFFAMERGIIVTNAHVLGMMLDSSKAPKQVDVVQDSGLPTETKMVGQVLGVDRLSDLAVIRVPDHPKLPMPLTLASETPTELQKIYIFGFPFGEKLGKNITISEQAITSLRPDKMGGLDQIQVNGGMNPGNSGGPVVNTHGNLVGVSVSIITGTQISFAVPAEKVRRVMEGRVTDQQHGDAYQQQGQARLPVRLTCLDPLNKIREMRVELWTGPPGEPRPRMNQKPQPLPGDGPRQEYVVKYANGVGALDVPLPPLPGGHVYWVQPVLTSEKGTHWGAAQQTAADLAVLERKPANLTIDLEKQKERTTKLDSRLTFIETFGKTENKQVIHVAAETLEVLQEPVMKDTKKTATIKTAYGPVKFDVNVRGKNVKFDKDELDAMAIVRGMPPTFVIDDTNGIVTFITVSLGPKSPKFYLKDLVQTLNNLVQNPYEATQIKMPNRIVQPQETFSAQSTMALRARSQQQAPPPAKGKVPPKNPPPPPPNIVDLKMNLTYQGVRMRNGREEAILTVAGTLESRKIKGRSLGDITGKIAFDTAGGFISSAKLKIFAESEETVPGLGTFRDSESTDIDLDRAAGNLKNLALRVDPPPAKDPMPGTGSAGGATKIVGGGFDPQFKDQAPDGGLLIGLDVGLGKFGSNDVIKAVRPIYRNAKGEEAAGMSYGKNFARTATVKAKPGYAIGGMNVNAGLGIDGFMVTFMKVDGAKLDPKDSYQSEYIGGKGGAPNALGGDGTPVVGIVGKANPNDCTGIGLLLKQEGNPGGPVAGGGAIANPAPNQFFNGDVTLRHLTFQKPGKNLGDLVWAPDGKSFYMLSDNGTVQQIVLATGQTTQFVELGRPASNLAMSGEGLLVAVAEELWIIDPNKLADIKKKIPVPGIRRVSAGTSASMAYAGPDRGNAPLQVVDLQKGAVVKTHPKVPIFLFRASPDGKYVFSVGRIEQLLRFRVNGDDLIEEEASYRISSNGQNISFSPDSKYVCLGTGGGNSKGHPDHPPVGNYSTFIYPIGNIKKPVTGFAAGGYPRVAGIDPKSGFIYAQNAGKPLIIYGFRNGDNPLGTFEFPIKGRIDVLEFSVSPVGGDALVRLEKSIVHIKVNKAGPPPLTRLEPLEPNLLRTSGLAIALNATYGTEATRWPLLQMP